MSLKRKGIQHDSQFASLENFIAGNEYNYVEFLKHKRSKGGDNNKRPIRVSGGRAEGWIQLNQGLVVQNHTTIPRGKYRTNHADKVYAFGNYAGEMDPNNAIIFCVQRGELAFRMDNTFFGDANIGGSNYADAQTVVTNLVKGSYSFLGVVTNPSETRGRVTEPGQPECVVGYFGTFTIVNNSQRHMRVGTQCLALLNANTTTQAGTTRLVAACQIIGHSHGATEQRFLMQTVPIRSVSLACNIHHITENIRAKLEHYEEQILAGMAQLDDVFVQFFTNDLKKLNLDMGYDLFEPFRDLTYVLGILYSWVFLIRLEAFKEIEAEAEAKRQQTAPLVVPTDTVNLPSMIWFREVTKVLRKLYANQQKVIGIHDTDILTLRMFRYSDKIANQKDSFGTAIQLLDNSMFTSGGLTLTQKKMYFASILTACFQLQSTLNCQAYELLRKFYLGRVASEALISKSFTVQKKHKHIKIINILILMHTPTYTIQETPKEKKLEQSNLYYIYLFILFRYY